MNKWARWLQRMLDNGVEVFQAPAPRAQLFAVLSQSALERHQSPPHSPPQAMPHACRHSLCSWRPRCRGAGELLVPRDVPQDRRQSSHGGL